MTIAGWRRFVYSTNHKDVGTMYLAFALFGGLVGNLLSMGIRAELMYRVFRSFMIPISAMFTTAHGLIMIFFMVMPAMIRRLRQLVRAADDRGARHGVPAHEQYRSGCCPLLLRAAAFTSMFIEASRARRTSAPDGRSTPLSTSGHPGRGRLRHLGLRLAGACVWAPSISSTIFNMRAPGMTMHKMPVRLVWW
jgi:cytochrome c oxidase subunit 1